MGHPAALPRNSAALGAEGREGWAHPREVGRPFRTSKRPCTQRRWQMQGSFDCVAVSLREAATPLRMTDLFGFALPKKRETWGTPVRVGRLREILSFTRRWNPTLTSKGATLGWGTRQRQGGKCRIRPFDGRTNRCWQKAMISEGKGDHHSLHKNPKAAQKLPLIGGLFEACCAKPPRPPFSPPLQWPRA
jgi:hypothetical protein